MTDFNTGNRDKVTVAAAYIDLSIKVARNNEHSPDSGLFIEVIDPNGRMTYASFSLESAKNLRDGIDSVIEDFATIEAEQETTKNGRLLESLPIGSVIQVNTESTRWYKSRAGWAWIPDGNISHPDAWFDGHGWDITVKYNPEED